MRKMLSIAVLVCALWPSLALADRLALVIGINDYDMIPKLTRAVGDAEAMSGKLTQLGFTVTTVLNPDRRELNQAITAFRRALRPGDAAVVHYSGHGVEVKGRNLLLPRDIPLPTSGEEDFLAEEAIDLSALIERVAQSGADVRIFIIDACRNNPFAESDSRGVGALNGLALVEPPRGSFVLYSAGYRQTALDRLGPDDTSPTSVYTRVLLDKLDAPGMSISEIARTVRIDVAALATTAGHEQSPAYYDELTQDFVLHEGAAVGAPTVVADSADALQAAAFEQAKDMSSVAVWNAFLKNYPEGVFADLARAALSDLGGAAAPEIVAAPEVAPKDDIDKVIADSQVHTQLDLLWDKGRDFASAGNDTEYLRTMNEAYELALRQFGSDSEAYAQANNHMIGAWTGMGRLDRAIDAAREFIRVYSALFGDDDFRVLNDKANLASRLNATGKTEEADALYRAIIARYESQTLTGWDRLAYAHALEGYSQVQSTMGQYDAADFFASRAVETVEQAGMTATIDYGWIAANYAERLLENGACADAQEVFAKAADGMKAARVAETQGDYARILRHLARGC